MTKSAQAAACLPGEVDQANDIAAMNKRWEDRRKSSFPATIVINSSGTALRCMVCDVSSTGALLDAGALRSPLRSQVNDVPSKFWLQMEIDRMQVLCEIKWRKENQLGVKFVSPMQAMPAKPRKMRKAEPEKKKTALSWAFNKGN